MKDLIFSLEITDAGETHYIPVPCRGIVKAVRVTSDIAMVATGTIIISRGNTAVNTITAPTGDTAAGIILDGVPDTTNKDLIFDPASSTAADKVIKIVADGTLLGAAGTVNFHITFDDSAYVEQVASEA
jgi:hypothetical protein